MFTSQKIQPGDIIFTNQYQTSVEGRVFSQRGNDLHQFKCLGGTLFYDAASKKICTYNQLSLSAYKTIVSKLKMEQEALS